LTDLYTVPVDTATVVSTLAVCNRTGSKKSFRVAVAVGGAVDSLEQYLWYDTEVLGNDSIFATIGMTLAAGDVVRVYASALGLSFNLFGTEVT
jgi:hypothetical protein